MLKMTFSFIFLSTFIFLLAYFFNTTQLRSASTRKALVEIPMSDKAARKAKFEGVYAVIRDELIEHFAGEGMPEEAVEWYRNVSVT